MSGSLSRKLLRELGITRVARVTGLDRTGVEVACAVRPLGHVLQVCNGKGDTWEAAARSAVSEAAELWAAERIDPTALLLASAEEMRRRFGRERVWGPSIFGSDDSLGRCSWIELERLDVREHVWVPAALVHCPPRGAPLFGVPGISWTSNGAAAHPDPELALRHALFEVIERDQLARALPHGWTKKLLRDRRVEALRERVAAIEARGFRCVLADLTPEKNGLGVPIAGALLIDEEHGPVPLTAGYAAAPTLERALISALHEAAQSRLTDIHGAREDVQPMDPEAVETLKSWLGPKPSSGVSARGRVQRAKLERSPGAPRGKSLETSGALLARLSANGHPVARLEWKTPDGALTIVKVVSPGLRRSELL